MFRGGSGRGPGGGQGGVAGQSGGRGSYAGIASINTSVRDNKNVLEVRLERTEEARFNLSISETESLLVKLGIGVVFITLHSSVNINRFLSKQECYILKKGIQTSVIRPAGKKEVSVFISGLHPNTKDQAVLKYLAAHEKVSQKDKVIHHVYLEEAGSSLLAGKMNGDRSYMVEITKLMGSYHIIDEEKVSVKYRGQTRTCARCHQTEKQQCSGKGVARDCQQDRVLLSTHMEKHWKEIGFTPDSNELVEEAEDDLEIQIGRTNIEKQINQGPDLTNRYSSIIISGFTADQNLPDIHSLLLGQGLPQTTKSEDLQQNLASGRVTINDLSPTDCLTIMERMHGKKFLGKKVYVNSVVSASPVKAPAVPVPNSPPQPPPLPSSLSPKRILHCKNCPFIQEIFPF